MIYPSYRRGPQKPKPTEQIAFWEERLAETKKKNWPIYRAIARTHSDEIWEKAQEEQRVLLHRFIQPYSTILDAGCGVGAAVPLLPDNESTYLGIDFAECLVKEARLQHPEKEFQVTNLLDLCCFSEDQFDFTFCRGVQGIVSGRLGNDTWLSMKEELKRISKRLLLMSQFSPTEWELIDKT